MPDGIFAEAIDGSLKIIAVELELTRKSRSSYRKVFETYLKKSRVSELWYIVPNEKIGQTLLKEWFSLSKLPGQITFRFTTVNELLSDPAQAVLRAPRGNTSLHSLANLRLPFGDTETNALDAQASAQPLGMLGRIAAANHANLNGASSDKKIAALTLGGQGEPYGISSLAELEQDSPTEMSESV